MRIVLCRDVAPETTAKRLGARSHSLANKRHRAALALPLSGAAVDPGFQNGLTIGVRDNVADGGLGCFGGQVDGHMDAIAD